VDGSFLAAVVTPHWIHAQLTAGQCMTSAK
jgi:hypothetical protein